MKRNTRDKVLELRILGRSIPDIARTIGVAKSTVVYWLNRSLEMRLINEKLKAESRKKNSERLKSYLAVRSEYWKRWREKIIQDAEYEYERISRDPLFIAGICLYWGEGDSNSDNPLRLSNTDPRMIKTYIEFLRRILLVPKDKIKLGVITYSRATGDEQRGYWAKVTGVDESKFLKNQVIKGKNRQNGKEYGTCMVVVNSKKEKLRVLKWIDIFSKLYYNNAR